MSGPPVKIPYRRPCPPPQKKKNDDGGAQVGNAYLAYMVVTRHVRGSRKRIPGSDPKDLDPGSVRIH